MIPRFLEQTGEVYRVLQESDSGSWLISYTAPLAPFFVAKENLHTFRRVPAPEGFMSNLEKKWTQTQKEKLKLIKPLLENFECIMDKSVRSRMASEIGKEYQTTPRRILRLYYHYLATGCPTSPKSVVSPQRVEAFDWAIRNLYFSSKRLSLRATYDMMLVQRFTSPNGVLYKNAPTWDSFRHYYYGRGYHRSPQKIIAREGLTRYQRDYRPVFGSVRSWRSEPGAYQMDASQVDVYLVSRHDRSIVVGRPYVYLAVDTATQLIAGAYVGFDCNEAAVMACIAQAAGNKEEYCSRFGIEIKPEQWPNSGIPTEIITDKGREFGGPRMSELCCRYGIEVQALAPFRPEQKGLVEKAFDLLQSRYKPLLRGKGVIEDDAQERWATDYRAQATLNLDEFTQIIIHSILYLNSGRLLDSGRTPAQYWIELAPDLLDVSEDDLRIQTLPRESAKLSRKGFRLNSCWYVPEDMDGLHLGDNCTIAYDPGNLTEVYLILPGKVRPCLLSSKCANVQGLSIMEADAHKVRTRAIRKENRVQETMVSTATIRAIQSVVQQAESVKAPIKKVSGTEIKANQVLEKERIT